MIKMITRLGTVDVKAGPNREVVFLSCPSSEVLRRVVGDSHAIRQSGKIFQAAILPQDLGPLLHTIIVG